MGRNDLCFCGSGKKQKKCHTDIESNSIVAELYSLYNEIDNRIEEHYKDMENKPPCHKGCSKCCSDYFTISNIEFDVILHEMQKWDKNKQDIVIEKGLNAYHDFVKNNPDYAKLLEQDKTGRNVQDTFTKDLKGMPTFTSAPCPFLDDKNSCMIYKVRPIICRTHGTALYLDFDVKDMEHTEYNCGHIKEGYLFKNMCDIRDLQEKCKSFTMLYSEKYDFEILRRERPIFFYFHYQFEKYNFGLDIVNYNYKFKSSRESYITFLADKNRGYMK